MKTVPFLRTALVIDTFRRSSSVSLRSTASSLWNDCHRQSFLFQFAARSTTPGGSHGRSRASAAMFPFTTLLSSSGRGALRMLAINPAFVTHCPRRLAAKFFFNTLPRSTCRGALRMYDNHPAFVTHWRRRLAVKFSFTESGRQEDANPKVIL